MRFIIAILIVSIAIGQFLPSNKPPGSPQTFYWPGMWAPSDSYGEFKLEAWHKDSFLLSWIVLNSEPDIGYPYHYGYVKGINDTIKVRVYFDNRSANDYYMADKSPETWFYPVLYHPADDVFSSKPQADTSYFNFRFEHWVNMGNNVITEKPDTIHTQTLHPWFPAYGQIFSIWGVNPGTYRVILLPTEAKPEEVRLVLDNPNNVFKIVSPQNVLDTLNAYSYIASNAILRREFTLFNNYVSNIMQINPQSIPGWALKYYGYEAQGDTMNAIAAIDSLLHIANNESDPFYPDSSKRTRYHELWLKDYKHNYPFTKWRLKYPEESRLVRFY